MYSKIQIEKACNIAIQNVIKEGTTDVDLFQRPFELELLKINDIRNEIVKEVINGLTTNKFENLQFHKIGHVLVPKKDLCDFRRCAWIDIVDEIKYLTIALLMAKAIEEKRDNKSKKRVFSYRLITNNKNGEIFDYNKYNYSTFKKRITEKSKMKNKKVVVECDISNFYDRLNLHRLESTLLSIEKIDKELIKILNELLLFWSNRDSYGLPVGSNASRILAEAALIEVDNYLISKNVDFCRFVDDYRIFAKNAFEAHKNLAILAERLSKEGLFLNHSKTKIKELVVKEKNIKKNKTRAKADGTVYKIIRGYSGLIPLKFRNLSKSEINKLKKEDENEGFRKLADSILFSEDEFKKTLKILIAKEKYEKIGEISNFIKKFPQFIPYYTDALRKNEDKLSEKTIELIKKNMQSWLENEEVPEYIQVYVIRLFALKRFKDKNIILNVFRNLKRNTGDYIGRVILECMEDELDRGEAIEVRDYYTKADIWEKREIIKILQKKLSGGENRPYFKDIQLNSQNILEKSIAHANVESDKKWYKKIKKLFKV